MENNIENWLRCNKCYRSMKNSTRTFSLTQCQHVFCNTCVVEVEKQCPECKSFGVKTVPLVKPLPQPLLHYFSHVGALVQQSLEASRFQRTQMLIAFRRFAEIQGKYEDMKRTYYQGAEQMKSLTVAYTQLKEKHTKILADIAQLRLQEAGSVAESPSSNFMRASTNHNLQQNPRMMDYVRASSHTRIIESRNDTGPLSLNSSRSSIATPFMEQHRRPLQQHVAQSVCQNRPKTDVPQYRYTPAVQTVALEFPTRVIPSYVMPSRNRILGSLRESSKFSSSDETLRNRPIVIDNYSNYKRN